MRPRELPAEDRQSGGRTASGRCRFNEAAGVTRGRPTGGHRNPFPGCDRFNEAAGVTRGRRDLSDTFETSGSLASMRPRELPAEDRIFLGGLLQQFVAASMRPRELPAEDRERRPGVLGLCPAGFNEAAGVTRGRPSQGAGDPMTIAASMRPRELPAEDLSDISPSLQWAIQASMRPRELPAEDLHARVVRVESVDASMRPRELPAEDRCRSGGLDRSPGCFNEAAGVTRGRPSRPSSASPARRRFNEAAGVTRGRPNNIVEFLDEDEIASMRPRELPAEDPSTPTEPSPTSTSFNEAAGVTRGRPAFARSRRTIVGGFNEAAGVTRGRPAGWACSLVNKHNRFNEAAGVTRGRPARRKRGLA